MLKEFMIFLITFALYLGPPTSLVLAWPVRMAGTGLLKQTLKFWKVLVFVYLVDVGGHLAVLAIRYLLGAYRPPVTLEPVHWLENFLSLSVAAFIACVLALRAPKSESPQLSGVIGFSMVVALMLLAADAVLYLILSTILMPALP